MGRYIVSTRRELRGQAPNAAEAVAAAPGVTVLNAENPDMVIIDTDEATAGALQARLDATHYVEPEITRALD